jgi:hypothetical protein
MRHRKLAVVLGILVLAACSAEGPANNKRDATAAALSLQKSPRKYKAPKFDSNVRVLAQIPIQGVKKDDDCDWSAEFAKAVSGYEAKHPEKEEGRGASLTEWDKDSCAAVVSIVVAKTHENVTPKTVDTLSIQVVGGPVVSPEFELVRRKLRDEDLVLNSDEGPNFWFPWNLLAASVHGRRNVLVLHGFAQLHEKPNVDAGSPYYGARLEARANASHGVWPHVFLRESDVAVLCENRFN